MCTKCMQICVSHGCLEIYIISLKSTWNSVLSFLYLPGPKVNPSVARHQSWPFVISFCIYNLVHVVNSRFLYLATYKIVLRSTQAHICNRRSKWCKVEMLKRWMPKNFSTSRAMYWNCCWMVWRINALYYALFFRHMGDPKYKSEL